MPSIDQSHQTATEASAASESNKQKRRRPYQKRKSAKDAASDATKGAAAKGAAKDSEQPDDVLNYAIFSRRHEVDGVPTIKRINAKLSIPLPDEECPLTLDPIATSSLAFMPNVPFLETSPLHTKLTLQCGHSFSAVPLIYHMCKNNMFCPCCRSGNEHRADFTSIPPHLREPMKQHIRSTLSTERTEDDHDAGMMIVGLRSATMSFVEISNLGHLSMTLTITTPSDETPSTTPVIEFNMGLHSVIEIIPALPSRNADQSRTVFSPANAQMRTLSLLAGVGTHLSAQVCMEIPGVGALEIEGVDFTIPTSNDPLLSARRVVRGHPTRPSLWRRFTRRMQGGNEQNNSEVSVSTFEFGFGVHDGDTFLNYVSWRPDMTHMNWMLRAE